MEKYKEYSIIQVDDGAVMVDKEAKIKKQEWLVSIFNNKIQYIDVCTEVDEYNKDKLNYNGKLIKWTCGKHCAKIIAHTGIESLKDSGLPLFEISDSIYEAGRNLAIKRRWNPDSLETRRIANEITNAYKEGYKASGGYTEEDIRNAFRAGGNYENEYNYPDAPDEDEYIKSLKKYPTLALVEMDVNPLFDHLAFEGNKPKVDQNNYLIIKQFNYE